MQKWDDYYKVIRKVPESATDWILQEYKYELRDNEDKLIGTYDSYSYAVKQAKYRFKKLQAKLEKILLT